jgi:predicted MPP superfamily phosphohydrolase
MSSLALTFWAEQDRVNIGWFLVPGFNFLGFLLTCVPLLLVVDWVRLVICASFRYTRFRQNVTATQKPKDWLWANLRWSLAISSIGLCIGGQWVAAAPPEIRRIELPISNLKPALEGYTILQLTDIHLRGKADDFRLKNLVFTANSTNANLIAITGDVVDSPMNHLRARLEPLRHLRARDGVWVVLGNHEYYADAEACVSEFERLGLTVLLDEHRLITHGGATLTVAGVTNPQHGMHGSKWLNPRGRLAHATGDAAKALQRAPRDSVKLLLAHQPASLKQLSALKVDLALAGHLHGGGFFPWTVLAPILANYRSLLRREGMSWVYVGRGIGTFGPKQRLGSPPEMTVIKLTQAS